MNALLHVLGLRGRAYPVPGGYTFVDRCGQCGGETRFREVEVRRGFALFSLPGTGEPRFRCDACGFMPVEQRRSRRR